MAEALTHIDKEDWPQGPWNLEPDRLVWSDDKTGAACLVQRNAAGALGGFVAVPADHPWAGLAAADVPVRGLSYAGVDESGEVDAVRVDGEDPGWWWLGFVAAKKGPGSGVVEGYRPLDDVRVAVTDLALRVEMARGG